MYPQDSLATHLIFPFYQIGYWKFSLLPNAVNSY